MNKKNLAIKISKHPLLRKLSEDKKIPKSILARLIVEELLKEDPNMMDAIKARIDTEVNDHDKDYNGIEKATQLIKDLPDTYTPELKAELGTYLKQKIADKKAGSSESPEKQKVLATRIIKNIVNSKDLNEYLDNFADGVDIFATEYPEYWKKRNIDPTKYPKEFKEQVIKFVKQEATVELFKDKSKRQGLVDAIKAVFQKY